MDFSNSEQQRRRHGGYAEYDDRQGSYGSGHGGSGHGMMEPCCPPVVDPLLIGALLTFLAAAVYFLQQLIEMSMLMMARKKRDTINTVLLEGKHFLLTLSQLLSAAISCC